MANDSVSVGQFHATRCAEFEVARPADHVQCQSVSSTPRGAPGRRRRSPSSARGVSVGQFHATRCALSSFQPLSVPAVKRCRASTYQAKYMILPEKKHGFS